ncbi:MAG: methyl-accepting chemotaxis protein [Oligoflexus sp.]
MDGLKKYRNPGLVASGVLHALGLVLLLIAMSSNSSSAGPNKVSAQVATTTAWADEAPKPEGEAADIPPWQDEPQPEHLQQAKPLKGSLVWMAMSCWFLSLFALTPSFLLSFKPKFLEDVQPSVVRPVEDDDGPLLINHREHRLSIQDRLLQSLDDLEASFKSQPVQIGEGFFQRSHRENVDHLDSQTKMMYNSITNTHDNVQKTVARVQRLFRQCRESANFAATNRLDWKKNTMLGNLSQVRQSHDRVLDTAKNISAIHASTLRLLRESIQGEDIFYEKVARVQEYLDQVQNSSNIGYKAHDRVIVIIGESKEGVANASKLVNGLAQRSESLLAVMKQVDDIAEKINLQALNASVALSRSKGRTQFDFSTIAAELRGLAARFHTQARHLQDMTESIHGEIDQALHHLTDASGKAEVAFASVNQCGELYRNNVSATKYGLSELGLIRKEVGIHMKKLAETRDLGESAGTLMSELDQQLSGYNDMNKRISEETNQMAAHCDKLSHLLSKQYYELSHCEKMLTDSASLLTEATQYATENKQNVITIKTGLEEIARKEPGKLHDDEMWLAKLRAFRHLVASLEEDFDSSSRTVDNRTSLVPVMNVSHG